MGKRIPDGVVYIVEEDRFGEERGVFIYPDGRRVYLTDDPHWFYEMLPESKEGES